MLEKGHNYYIGQTITNQIFVSVTKNLYMKKIFLLILLINTSLIAYNQVIKGTIFDNKTKEPVFPASVYLNGTFVGTLTDQSGNFQLDISKYPTMPLTVSAIGYYSVTVKTVSTKKPLSVYLEPKLYELNEVVINAKARPRERKESMVIFRNEFLGTTGNSFNCEIMNEDDIRFNNSDDGDTVRAYAVKPILIENDALGYKITYYLDKFEYCKTSSTFFFKGNIIFSEDLTSDETRKKLYEKKRKNAYRGSRMQFFRALWIDDLNSAGFTVKNTANETLDYNRLVTKTDSRTKYLTNQGTLGISYYSKQPTSFIVFLKYLVFFDANGYFDPEGISWEGEMARQRIADLLPYEYVYE